MDKRPLKWLLAAFLLGASATVGISLSYGENEPIAPRSLGERETRHSEHHFIPKLYDARGNLVGEVVIGRTFNDTGAVVVDVNGALIYVKFSRVSQGIGFPRSATRMVWNDDSSGPVFDGPNCTGTAYVFANSVLRPAALVREGAKATLFVGAEGRAEDHTIRSSFIDGQCVGRDPYVFAVWRVETTLDLTGKYPEPLRVGF